MTKQTQITCTIRLEPHFKSNYNFSQILNSEILQIPLHWLDVPDRVIFKLAVIVHRCLNGRAPPYLSDYCAPVASADRRHLHFTNCQLLAVPRYRLNTYGRRTFSVAGPSVWNSLPNFIRDPTISLDCSLDTSAFSALEVLTTTALYKFTYLLTYLNNQAVSQRRL